MKSVKPKMPWSPELVPVMKSVQETAEISGRLAFIWWSLPMSMSRAMVDMTPRRASSTSMP